MAYRVEELAAAAGISVDTVRYYQSQGLLAAPERSGRVAHYNADHLERLTEIRTHADRGFTLAQIRELLRGPTTDDTSNRDSALRQLAERSPQGERLDRDQLAAASGLERSLVDLTVDAGLLRPATEAPEERFGRDAVEMLGAASTLLTEGVLSEELAALAVGHAEHVERLVAEAVTLVVGRSQSEGLDGDELVERFDRLAPAVATLVARHFEQALLSAALEAASAVDTPMGAPDVASSETGPMPDADTQEASS